MKRKGLSRRLLSVLLTLVMLLSMLPQVVFAADPTPKTYKKVTEAPKDWSGTYLIVSEANKAALDSSLATIDATNDYKSVEITEDKTIETAEAIAVTIEKMADGNYSIKAANGQYIYRTQDKNGLDTGKNANPNTISLNADGTVNIVSGGAYLRFNANKDQMRFRYFKSGTYTSQKPVTLYKLEEALARPSGVISDLSMLEDGDKVVIFNPSANMALSVNSAGKEFYRAGVAVTLENTNHLTGYGDTELWTVGIKDGKYTFTSADGKKLSMNATNASLPLDADNNTWELKKAATEGCFYIINAARPTYYVEWYAQYTEFSTFTYSESKEDIFAMKLFLVTDAGGSDPEPEPTAVPISTALAGAKDEKFTVKGVVTFMDGSNVYLQDATGGICLYLSAADDNIKLGDTIVGTGTRGDYNGQPQLSKGTYVKSSGLTLAAKPTTIGAITNADICTYVKLTDLEITEIYDKNGSFAAPNVTVKDAEGKTIQIFKAAMKKVDGSYPFAVGDKVDVTAAVGYFNKLQLRTTVASEITAHRDIFDPISDDMIPAGVKTVKEAGAITAKTENVTVIGQVVYHYGNAYNNKASINSIILEDVIDGEIYGFQVYDFTNYANYKVGDIVKVTGTVDPYGGVPQMKNPAMEVVKTGVEAIPAQEITVSQMGANYLSEYVYIKDVTLGTYNATSNTTVTDASGTTNLYKGAPLATGVTVADITAVYGCCSAYNGTYQLRNGTSADYVSGVTPPTPGGSLTVGSKVVIYNNNSKTAMAADGGNGSISQSGAVEIKDSKLLSGNGAAIFEVRQSGQYYRFYNDTYGYLSASGTGTGNKAYYSMTADENADWLVRTCSGNAGGYEMESRTAKFKGYSQWMEYYANGFTVYSMDPNKVTDYTIYSFNFYPVADTVATIGGIVNNPAVVLGKLDYAYVSTNYTFTFTVDAPFGVKGDVSAKLGTQALDVVLGEEGVYTVTVPAASLKGEGTITVTVSGMDNKNIAFSADAVISVKDEPMFANPSPARGFQTGDDKRPTISVELTNAGENPTITMTVAGKPVTATYANGKITYTPAADLADGRTEVTVTAKRADNKEASFNWFFTVGKTKYQAYFGQLHSHTQYSDGSGTLASALEYIKGLNASANIQFVAFTDHSNYFDKSGAANPEGALYDMSKATDYSRGLWSEYKGAIADFNAVNGSSLLALGGFEMTWSGGPGHINTFNTAGIVSRNNTVLNNKTADSGMKAYYALLSQAEGAESISQFNHPGKTFGNFSDFAYYDPVIDSRMYMVEVGNGEGQIGAGGYYPSYEQYIMALDKGWHLAPTNNQDNHKGRWGNANDARDVIITDDFSEAGIYEAIRAMRMYSTEDKNLELTYTVNGLMMGSSIKTEEVPDKLLLEVTVTDPDKTDTISKVEVVVNSGKVVHTWNDPAELAKGILSVSLDPDYSYYFIRVTQGDGDLAVTSPVWVGDTLKLGVSNLVCGTATPVTNEELTLTATLFNSEDVDATVKSLTYTIGNTVIGVDKGADGKGYTLAKSSTLDIPFKYTPTTARVFTVQVTAVVEQNNKEYTFTKTIELDVLDADSLVYIGIDASHYNEYVNGNYKDSMGNFGNLAAEYSVRTVQLNTGDELLAACKNPKFKAIILTAPSRRDDKKIRDPYATYSDAEIKAIADFNAAGGTVILAGWSDYYESYGSFPAADHMAAQQNLLLAAMGSSLRISDDATKDEVRSAVDGVETHRLYFSDYNMANPLNKGVIVDDDHPYDKMYTERFSHYGGASVYVVDANGTPTSKLPDTVSPVVYGHATTYSMDSDGVGVGGAAVPKYAYKENDTRLMVMATEQLEGKGMIIVSGAAFMSNFEVQATIDDNGAEKNYSNYRICENLVQSLNPVKITPISEVHQQPDEGVKYTIEGIVTSNASGYDQRTAFFDCIYVQDETGGINCFPVAGNFKIGDRVRVSGTTSSYQGERQLAVTKIEKIGEGTPVQPKVVTATQVNDGSVLGQLITLKGHVTAIEMAEGKVQTILVKDADGKVARVFIDGYICSDTEVKDLKVGCEIAATGLASYDNTFVLADGTAIAPRIRISNRADVVCTACTCGESGGDTPKTGDSAHMVLWVSMMTVTALAGAAMVLTRKRRS